MRCIRLAAVASCLTIQGTAWADLRTYDVDFQHRQEIYEALQRVLIGNPADAVGHARYGRVQLLPSGQILVDAEPSTLEQVEQVIRAIRERPADAAPRVALRYWALLGMPAAANVEDVPSTAPAPSVLDDVLTELQRYHGDLEFRVIGTAALVTPSGQVGHVDAMPLSVSHTAYVQERTLNVEISMRLEARGPAPRRESSDAPFAVTSEFNGSLNVEASLTRGEFVVLGESTVLGGGLDGTLFYIVHWPDSE